jgi:hypothetical protein
MQLGAGTFKSEYISKERQKIPINLQGRKDLFYFRNVQICIFQMGRITRYWFQISTCILYFFIDTVNY